MGSDAATLVELFDSFPAWGQKTAMVFRTGIRRHAMTYDELHQRSLKMASWLSAKGVRPGDRVVLWAPNSPWWGITYWGSLVAGAVVVPVDFMSGLERAETIAKLTEAKIIIQSRLKAERFPDNEATFMEDLPFLTEESLPPFTPVAVAPEEIAQLVYTSGTTGNPKGVILTHQNLAANLRQVNRHIPIITSQFTFLSLLPLSHMFEQMAGFLTPLANGSTIVYLPVLKPTAIMEAFAEEDVYATILVPRLLQLLKGSIERELDAKHLGSIFRFLAKQGQSLSVENRKRLFYPIQRKFGRNFTMFVSGGAALDPVVARFWEDFGFVVLEGYGLTECSPIVAANAMDDRVIGSIGRALPGVDVKIAANEVLVKGPNVFPGYYNNQEATKQAFSEDGWFKTGDMGEVDESGRLRIKGRSKEIIVTGGGINVYPDEIEAVLGRIRGVRESCVVGLDRGAGEEVHAVLILDESERDPQVIIQEANSYLDPLHHITGASLWPDAEFPKTTTMKIQKFKVKERMLESKGGAAGPNADKMVLLISRVTGVPAAEIKDNSYLAADLGLTSIARLELVNILELEYRLDLEDTAIDSTTTVEGLRNIISRREKSTHKNRFRFWTNGKFVTSLRRLYDSAIQFPLLKFYVSIEKEGLEKLNHAQGPVMLISNHTSYLDQPVLMMALPARLRYRTATAAWEEFFFPEKKPLWVRIWKEFTYNYATILENVFPLPQSKGFRPALKYMGKLVDSGINILVFPEGERSWDGKLLPFQLGVGIMVRELDVPIIPVKVEGLENVLPRGAKWPKKGKVRVTFGEPIRFQKGLPGEIVEEARKAVARL